MYTQKKKSTNTDALLHRKEREKAQEEEIGKLRELKETAKGKDFERELDRLRRALDEEAVASQAQREEFQRLRQRLLEEEAAGRKAVEAQRKLVDAEEQQVKHLRLVIA